MNTFGPVVGLVTLFILGLGFVWVIRGERYLGLSWWPYPLTLGILLALCSACVANDWISALLGVAGASFAWGATEFKEQAIRAELGWFPFGERKIRPPFADIIDKWKAPHL